MGVGLWRRLARNWRLVHRATAPPKHLTTEIRRLAEAMGARPMLALVVPGIASPYVWCIGWLRLLWPERIASEADVLRCRGVIAHELAHVWRRDHWVAWMELVAGVVWWWNPLFWYVRRRLRETAEIACDAVALSVVPDDRRQYAEAFLELSSIGQAWAPAPVLGMSTGARRTFERRFAMMLSERVRSKMSLSGFLAVGLLALITLPSWSLGQTPSRDGRGSAPVSSGAAGGPATLPAAGASRSQTARDDDRVGTPFHRSEPSQDAASGVAGQESGPPSSGLQQDAVRLAAPDGKVVAVVVGDEGNVSLQLAQTGKELRMIAVTQGEYLSSLAFSPDGRYLAGMSSAGKLSLVDPATGKRLWVSDIGKVDGISFLSFSRDGKVLVAGKGDGPSAETWNVDVTTGAIAQKGAREVGASEKAPPRPAVGLGARQYEPKKTGAPANDSLESRVQKLEDKLDAILQELRSLRGASDPTPRSPFGGGSGSVPHHLSDGGSGAAGAASFWATSPDGKLIATRAGETIVSLLDAATGTELRRIDIGRGEKIRLLDFSADESFLKCFRGDRKLIEVNVATGKVGPTLEMQPEQAADTSAPVAAGPKLNVPADPNATPTPPGQVEPARSGAATLHAPAGKSSPQPGGSATQVDLVSLGTATIEARGALRLTQARHDRLKRLGSAAAVSQEEVEAAGINLETAQQRLELLTSIARFASDSADAELPDARAAREYARKLFEKGYVSQTQVEQAEAQVLAAEAKLKLLESIVGPTPPPHAAVDQAAVEKAELNAARAEVDVAIANAKRLIELRDKGGATQSEVEHAEAQVLAAQAKLKLLEAKLNPKTPPSSDAKSKK